MAAHDQLDSILDDERAEARAERRRHRDAEPDDGRPDNWWHQRGCRCDDCDPLDLRGKVGWDR